MAPIEYENKNWKKDTDKNGYSPEGDEPMAVDKQGAPKKTRRKSHTGKKFEDEFRHLLEEICSYVRRVHDTRSLGGSSRYIAPKVHCDFEGMVWYRDGTGHHLYIECKTSKQARSFEFWHNIIEGRTEKGKDPRSKEHQWGWVREVANRAPVEDHAFYAVGNRHSGGDYYIILMDWEDIQHWMKWVMENEKGLKSVTWEKLKRHAGEEKTLWQTEDDTTARRFVNEDNIRKLRAFCGITSMTTPVEIDYEW